MNRLAKNNESTSVIIATAPKKSLLKGFIEASVKMQPRSLSISHLTQPLWYVILSSLSKMVTPIDVAPQTPDMMCICRLDKEN